MNHHDNTQPQTLVRIWLRTTDRLAPLRSIWIAAVQRPTAVQSTSADISDGGAMRCA